MEKIIKSESNKNYFVQWQEDQFKSKLWRPVFKSDKKVAKKFKDLKDVQKEKRDLESYFKKHNGDRKLKIVNA